MVSRLGLEALAYSGTWAIMMMRRERLEGDLGQWNNEKGCSYTNFMKTKPKKPIFSQPECHLLTQGESGLPRLHISDNPPLPSLSYLSDFKVNHNLRGRESSGVCNVTVLSSRANKVFQ